MIQSENRLYKKWCIILANKVKIRLSYPVNNKARATCHRNQIKNNNHVNRMNSMIRNVCNRESA